MTIEVKDMVSVQATAPPEYAQHMFDRAVYAVCAACMLMAPMFTAKMISSTLSASTITAVIVLQEILLAWVTVAIWTSRPRR